MKKISAVLLFATLLFGALSYYFMYHADSGADGLSNFIPLVFTGALGICSLFAFLLSLFLNKGQSKATRNWIVGIAITLPIIGFLLVTGVFSYFTADYQNQWDVQINSNKSVLSNQEFTDEKFGVSFQHVSGNVTTYENGTPIPTLITPRIENEKLIVPVDDESYLEPDVLVKLPNAQGVTLSQYVNGLKKKMNSDLHFKKGSSNDFPQLSKSTEIWMLGEGVSYEQREQVGKYFLPEKTGQSDIIYFFKPSDTSQNILVLVVSSKMLSAPAAVEKMSSSNFEDHNLWFHSLRFLE